VLLGLGSHLSSDTCVTPIRKLQVRIGKDRIGMDREGKERNRAGHAEGGEDREEVVVARIRKNGQEELVVSRGRFKGSEVLGFRVFANGIPLRNKGLTIGVGIGAEFIKAAQQALDLPVIWKKR
jgi:hypothetical protein